MFGENLRIARNSKNLTLEQLATMYNKKFNGGLSKGTLSKYENNKQEPMITVVGNLASLLNVTVDFLLDDETTKENNIYNIENIIPKPHTSRVPLIGEIACGQPIECNQTYEYVDADIKADACLMAKGDSMINARIKDGDIVFIKYQPEVENGQIAAVVIDNEATLKRIYYDRSNNVITLSPANPDYQPMIYIGEQLNQIKILGKAVGFLSCL